MSQFEYDGDRGSYELLKMIKGAIDEDPTQRKLAQNVINSNNSIDTNNKDCLHVDIIKGDNGPKNNNNIIGDNYNSSYENFKKDLMKYDGIDVSKTDKKEEENKTKNEQPVQKEKNLEEKIIDIKQATKNLDDILSQIKIIKKENEVINQNYKEEAKKIENEKPPENEEEEEDEDDIKMEEIKNSGADIEFNFPRNYIPNFESPIYCVISFLMEKYGFDSISDKIIKNGNRRKNIEERKEEINIGNEIGNMGDNLWDDKKEDGMIEEKKEDINMEEKKENINLEDQKDQTNLEEKKEGIDEEGKKEKLNLVEIKENINSEAKKEESKVEKQIEIPKEKDELKTHKEESKTEIPKEKVKIDEVNENKEKKEDNILEDKGEEMNLKEEKKEGEEAKNNEAIITESKKEEEKEKQEKNLNGMNINNDGVNQNCEHQKNLNDLNISLQSEENETEEEIKLRKILNSLIIMGGYSNITYFVIQYRKYLDTNKNDDKNQMIIDDGFNEEEFLKTEETHTRHLTEREIIKLKRDPNSGNILPSANSMWMPPKKKEKEIEKEKEKVKEKEKPVVKKTTYSKPPPRAPNYYEEKKLYYQKGGRVGMHYFTSNDDGNIYKYYCTQYNNDGTYGFKCTENSCKSKALLDRNKNFNIIIKHTLSFQDHTKLHGSYLRDKFIKFMLQKN